MRLHGRMAGHLVHRAGRADHQPAVRALPDLADAGEAFQIDHALRPDEPAADADQQVGAAHEGPGDAGPLRQQCAGLGVVFGDDVVEGLQRWNLP